MKSVSLSGSLRENVGKKDARKNRRDGKIPCVMYGGKEEIHLAVDNKQFTKIFYSPEVVLIKLNIDGKEHDTIVQEVQYHPVTDNVLHIDFLEVLPDKPVTIAIPVKLHGTPSGVLKGGKLIKKARKLKVRALSKDLPDTIDIDISALEINDSVKVADVAIPNVDLLDPASNIVAGVRTARTVVEEAAPGAAAEGEAAPEGEKKEEGK